MTLTTLLLATEILFTFDTEDFTSPQDADGIKELAELFTEEGVKAHFVTVGYLGRALVQWGRYDVIEAMKKHYICDHTLSHSLHPNLLEISDDESFEKCYALVREREREAIGMIKGATGAEKLWAACPPGNTDSYVAYYYWAKAGIPFYIGGCYADNTPGEDVWFCNLRQIPYTATWEQMFPSDRKITLDQFVEKLAKTERAIVYCHPNKVHALEFWDILNYYRGNLSPWGQWKIAPRRPAEEVKEYLDTIREGVRRFKRDPRFKITTLPELDATKRARVDITRADVGAIRKALAESFGPIRTPASWSLSDVFAAAVRFLRGDRVHTPGFVYGFLYAPRGVAREVTVSTADLRAAAEKIELDTFLPPSINVGGQAIGPADFLFAALEAVETGAASVVIRPKPQMPGWGPYPHLADLRFKGTWLHAPSFKDNFASDRIRLQIWTLREEGK